MKKFFLVTICAISLATLSGCEFTGCGCDKGPKMINDQCVSLGYTRGFIKTIVSGGWNCWNWGYSYEFYCVKSDGTLVETAKPVGLWLPE